MATDTPIKICSKCGETKPVDQYLQGHNRCNACKNAYHRKYYLDNKQTMLSGMHSLYELDKRRIKDRIAKYNRGGFRDLRRRRIQEFINNQKAVPCTDCNNRFHSVAMDFDHIPERGKKKFSISSGVVKMRSMNSIIAEISKCEVVCSNCHRVRTYNRKHNITNQ